RTETKISEMAVSVSYAAVELAKKIFSDLSEKTVLLVGAGEMAKLAARHFIANGVRHVRVTTRSPQHAQELANRFGGTAVAFEEFREDMASADIVLVSTGAAHYLVSEDDVQHSVKQRMNRPMFLIDISVPRNIDPAVRHVDNAFLFDIDDLKTRVERNRGERLNEAEKAERMVVDEVGIVRQWLQSLEVTPTIVALRARVEDIKQAELDKTLGRLANLSTPERELVEAMASSIVNKLIHNTMVTLKAEVNSSEGTAFIEAARRFFSLGDPSASNVNDHTSSASEACHSSQEDIQSVDAMAPRTGSKTPDR
ncbi:MAG: glutamyl-tRNA reductase, partial [Nitrospirae bacterium]|nr:glutamyl-tRNA reductase [Nitrospirota bacterium]